MNLEVTRRQFLHATAATGLAAAGGFGQAPAGSAKSKPNVLCIITDQQHLETLSALGCPSLSTPAMDSLVATGTSFIKSYCPNPLCSPSRSSLFTGRMSSETNVWRNDRPIRDEVPNLGQWLGSRAGYDCVYSGKWHLPFSFTEHIPGFRAIATGLGNTGIVGDAAASWAAAGYLLNRAQDQPFFLVASFLQPHDICGWTHMNGVEPPEPRHPMLDAELPPLPSNFLPCPTEPKNITNTRFSKWRAEGADKWSERHWRYYRYCYYRMVEMVDAEIARVLWALEASGQRERTLVIFTSDHGEGLAHHQMTHKNFLYDEAAAVPLVLSWPGVIPTGQTDREHLVSGLDLVPTICDFVGIDPPSKQRGRSLRPVLEGRPGDWRDTLFVEVQGNLGRAVRTHDYKYIRYIGDPTEQLFDLRNDPGEEANLATDAHHADTLQAHRTLLREWERGLDPARETPLVDAWRQ